MAMVKEATVGARETMAMVRAIAVARVWARTVVRILTGPMAKFKIARFGPGLGQWLGFGPGLGQWLGLGQD